MISSRSVNPRAGLARRPHSSNFCRIIFFYSYSILALRGPRGLLLHSHRGLRSIDGNGLLTGIACPAARNRERSLSAGLSLES